MSPAVSVIIATYNYGHYLAGALESALRQTLAEIEVLVVDDGSTDQTREVVGAFLSDPRVRYERRPHSGQPQTKNAGIRLARAPLIAFLDADDLWMPTKLQRQAELFARDPQLGVAYCRRRLIDPAGEPLPYRQPTLHRGNVLERMFLNNFVCFSSSVVHRRVFDRVGVFDERIPMAIDYDLWLRAAQHFRFDFVDEELVAYRTGHANLSTRGEERLLLAFDIMDRFLHEHRGRELIPRPIIRQGMAETYSHLGLEVRNDNRWMALRYFLRALSYKPHQWQSWKGIASLLVK